MRLEPALRAVHTVSPAPARKRGAVGAPRACFRMPDRYLCFGFLPFAVMWKVLTVGAPPSEDLYVSFAVRWTVLPFASFAFSLLDGLTVSFSGTPAVPLPVAFPETVFAGRHLPLILTWPFLQRLAA